MRNVVITIYLFLFALCVINAQEQTPATEAGEDFDLNAVIELMEKAEDLADLEKKINDEENQVNNLDLNKDEEIDVIKVVEYDEENTRLIVLQAVLSETEVQDIATIEIEKHSEDEISLQVIGDPDIYGPDYIIEPAPEESSTESKGGGDDFHTDPFVPDYLTAAVFVSVHRWRPIGPLFVVGRVMFVSAVGWRPAPVWFIVRRPIARSTWRARSRRYRSSRYRSSRSRHSTRGKSMYSSKRKKSNVAKKNMGPKPGPSKGPNTGPSAGPSNQAKKANNSPGKSTSPKKSTAPKASQQPNKNSAAKKQSPSRGKSNSKGGAPKRKKNY